jgi:hypothetical protein
VVLTAGEDHATKAAFEREAQPFVKADGAWIGGGGVQGAD